MISYVPAVCVSGPAVVPGPGDLKAFLITMLVMILLFMLLTHLLLRD